MLKSCNNLLSCRQYPGKRGYSSNSFIGCYHTPEYIVKSFCRPEKPGHDRPNDGKKAARRLTMGEAGYQKE
jgi:hypothetical protein